MPWSVPVVPTQHCGFHSITAFLHFRSAFSDFSHGAFFFLSNQDIKSGQSPLMHAVESNNADMVYFLIEVMNLCG